MPCETITLDLHEGVATITLNRPDKLNALNPVLVRELSTMIDELNKKDEAKVLVITGAGRAFCSGADVTTMSRDTLLKSPNVSRNKRMEPLGDFGWLTRSISEFAKPIIAAVNGIAAGAGLALAIACDIRIAADNARFSAIFVRRGLIADCATTYNLPRLVGVAKALELMWTGDIIDAAEAERIGLISRVVAADQLIKEVNAFASRLARGPTISIELMKRLTYEGLKVNSLETQLSLEDAAQYVCVNTEDFKEGIASFMKRREAQFKGR